MDTNPTIVSCRSSDWGIGNTSREKSGVIDFRTLRLDETSGSYHGQPMLASPLADQGKFMSRRLSIFGTKRTKSDAGAMVGCRHKTDVEFRTPPLEINRRRS